MENIATIAFSDHESGDEGIVIVRAAPGTLALALSLRKDGDMEVFLGLEECEKLTNALGRAITIVKGTSP